ncbi:MAG TPA: ribonuclease E inhibitor RraB [Steroidobacteraceae bacterium]|nr:ribonuclease E inhibitor RraB [Steroidobacteraceae bacterium]
MSWLLLTTIAAGAVIVARLYVILRKSRAVPNSDWDAQMIERLRSQGSDPFQPHDVDFFFALPTEAACETVRKQLQFEGFAVDVKPVPDSSEQPFSLHATKPLRLSVPSMREFSRRFGELATAQGGRYDGWTAGVVQQHTPGWRIR